MGMFDWYVPEPPLACPKCSTVLHGWQGKSGPCLLFEWMQGDRAPSRQLVDEPASEPVRTTVTLPNDFEIHTSCTSCGVWIQAAGACENDVWTRVDFVDPLEPPGLPRGWTPILDDAPNILAELRREISPGHTLHGCRMIPLARRTDCDHVLVRAIGAPAPLYLVHLTWRAQSDPQWPSAEPFVDISEFAATEGS